MKHALCALPILLIVGIASSATPTYHRDIPSKLAAEAKIGEDAAVSSALATVPKGEVKSVELEREGGQLLYSVDIKAPGKNGVEEVHVSADDGRVLSHEHESAKKERQEAAAEKKEKEAKSH